MSKHTDVTIILDRSGSMNSIKEATIKGFNTFLKQHKKETDNTRITLVTFNEHWKTHYEEKQIKKKRYLTPSNYLPNGTTSLYDAVGYSVDQIDRRIKKYKTPPQVIIGIFTDGLENSSKEHTAKSVKKLLNDRIQKQDWGVLYLGANQDAVYEGGKMGILYSLDFDHTLDGIKNAFDDFIKYSLKDNRKGIN